MSSLERCVDLVRPGGRVAVIGSLGGTRAALDVRALMRKRITVGGSTIRARSAAAKASIARELHARCWSLFEAGAMRAVLDEHAAGAEGSGGRFELADAVEAHRWMEAGRHVGKIGLRVAQG